MTGTNLGFFQFFILFVARIDVGFFFFLSPPLQFLYKRSISIFAINL